jgi:hypothetical protein
MRCMYRLIHLTAISSLTIFFLQLLRWLVDVFILYVQSNVNVRISAYRV